MNKKKLTETIQMYSEAAKTETPAAMKEILLANGLKDADVNEVIAGLYTGSNKPSEDNTAVKTGPNADLDLSEFDYKQLKGESFKKYAELVGDAAFRNIDENGEEKPVPGTLLADKEYDFHQFRVRPIFKIRFPGVKDSPKDFVGMELVNDVPIHTTRISVKTARSLNAQITNEHSRANGKYYLLKK
jgi:hypothetical protein